jgi:predicted nucleic acid-binding protein
LVGAGASSPIHARALAGGRGDGATRHAAELAEWLSRVLAFYPERILPFGLQEALQLRQLARAARTSGVEIGMADMMVASIAVTAELVVATRNEKHFAAMGVAVENPFR